MSSAKDCLIPDDLIPGILSRLPARSIVRFRCVSRYWDSIIRGEDLTEKFLNRSCARPQLLFAFHNLNEDESGILFFSSPQPQNLDDENPSLLVATFHMKVSSNRIDYISSAIGGFVCFFEYRIFKGRKNPQLVTVVSNPTTGKTFALPKMKTRKWVWLHSFLGYDPIDKHFKVLAMTDSKGVSAEHQVLTLGTTNMKWRMIQCAVAHSPGRRVICINGVLYYQAGVNSYSSQSMVVCFDVRTETFSFIELEEAAIRMMSRVSATLVDYKGKLALLAGEGHYIDGTTRSFEMRVLEDPETHQWLTHTYELSPEWRNVVGNDYLRFAGVTDANEIVLSSGSPSDAFYVIYYSFEKNTIRRFAIQGLGGMKRDHVNTFLSHVESVKHI